jgi:predicted Zn-dependent protease
VDATLEAHASSAGLWFYRRATKTGYSVTVRSDGTMGAESSRVGSGWAGIGDMRRADDVDVEAITAVAADKARRSANPQPFPMGRYTVILEPIVTAAFFGQLLSVVGGRARSLDVWGFPPAKPGERVASEQVTIRSKPDHPQILASPYGPGGRPAREVLWIEKGPGA